LLRCGRLPEEQQRQEDDRKTGKSGQRVRSNLG
jgi:hypothetical protein